MNELNHVKASTFADLADVKAFRACKAKGKSDEECFKVGDNGIGCTGLNVADESIPYVALPPDDWTLKYDTKAKAMGKPVNVTLGGKTVRCILGDTMPWKKNIKNGCGIDLAPGVQKLFGIKPGTYPAAWEWAE